MGGLGHDRRLPFIVSDLRDIVLLGFRHRGGPVRARLGVTLGASAFLLPYSPKCLEGGSRKSVCRILYKRRLSG
jgi:hypothetical protein